MRGKPHTDETRAQVIAALLAGQGVNEVAAQYDLPKETVSYWKKSIPDAQLALIRTKKGERIEVLLFDYLTTLLETLRKQAEIAGEREYVHKQPADSLAVLHGVMADKGIRLLEAAHRANEPAEQLAA